MIDPNLLQMLQSSDAGQRKQAVLYLAQNPNSQAMTYLQMAAQNDPDWEVRQIALQALQQIPQQMPPYGAYGAQAYYPPPYMRMPPNQTHIVLAIILIVVEILLAVAVFVPWYNVDDDYEFSGWQLAASDIRELRGNRPIWAYTPLVTLADAAIIIVVSAVMLASTSPFRAWYWALAILLNLLALGPFVGSLLLLSGTGDDITPLIGIWLGIGAGIVALMLSFIGIFFPPVASAYGR